MATSPHRRRPRSAAVREVHHRGRRRQGPRSHRCGCGRRFNITPIDKEDGGQTSGHLKRRSRAECFFGFVPSGILDSLATGRRTRRNAHCIRPIPPFGGPGGLRAFPRCWDRTGLVSHRWSTRRFNRSPKTQLTPTPDPHLGDQPLGVFRVCWCQFARMIDGSQTTQLRLAGGRTGRPATRSHSIILMPCVGISSPG